MTAIPYTSADIEYVEREFVSLEQLCRSSGREVAAVRAQVSAGNLPRPTYVLPDGREMVPASFFVLADAAGSPELAHDEFLRRFQDAAAAVGIDDDPQAEWEAYLSGEYGVCLREVSPEAIVRKSMLVNRIEQLIRAPSEESPEWASDLYAAVDALDLIELPFAPHYDFLRFGVPSSRERLIIAVRARFPEVFAPRASQVSL